MTITSVGLWPHTGKPAAMELAAVLSQRLRARGVAVWLCHEEMSPHTDARSGGTKQGQQRLEEAVPQTTGICRPEQLGQHVQLLIVLGGDGALLAAARAVAATGLPVLGVNVGHLGFLTELEAAEAVEEATWDRLLRGEFELDPRLMLAAEVRRAGTVVARHIALNDVVITRTTFARMIHLETYVAGEPVVRFLADGMIVATPTGSTAYSLSAGGPIVSPRVEAILVTPICPHTLATRSILVPPGEEVHIGLQARAEGVMLTVDGQIGTELQSGDRVVVEVAPYRAQLVRLRRRSFYSLLSSRLQRGQGEW
ncbi:MAG: NAD(+)/NADH kinase [Limnochordaceae bacterium]|nr:NAD(+)/NADH kinase [Limnochordaceae bacterium]